MLGVLGRFGGQAPAHDLPWFMVFTATLASIYGFFWGFLAAGVSALLLGPSGPEGLFLLLSAGLAHGIGKSLRQAHRRARALAKSHRFIAEALQALTQVEHRQDLLKSLPERLASLGEGGHIGVWVPQGEGLRCLSSVPPLGLQEIPARGVVGRALREGKPQHVPDVRQEPDHIAAPGFSTLAELALPLFERGEGVAVLNLERSRPFLNEEVEGLTRFAETVSLQLDRLADLEVRRLLTELATGLQGVHTLHQAAEMALALLLKELELEAGVIWRVQGARMETLAHLGISDPGLLRLLREGLPYGQGLAWEVYRTGEPHYTQAYPEHSQGVATLQALDWRTLVAHPVPTSGSGPSRFVLVVGERAQRPWRRAERELLSLFCRTLGVGFERLVERARHEGLNRLTQELLDKPSDEPYQRVLQEAIRQVPGSEAGSLLVLEGGEYRFKAAVGYDLKGLQTLTLSPQAALLWYGLGEEQAHRGEPRLITTEGVAISEVSHQTAPPEVIDTAGRVREIQANLCLPMAYRGEVLAYLNLDNLHDPRALGEDSLRAARFFAAPLATLLHEQRTHRLLEKAALTDALTGLPNRRAFDRALPEELERAARYAYPLSLAVLDLKGFKAINDRLGHATGDQALTLVARALERERRSGDYLFRWGGDEFAAIFSYTSKEEALVVALRYAQAIGGIRFGELCLGVSIGLAAYPEDGTTPDALLVAADTRMYQAKASGSVVSL
nr:MULTISPECIES: diguanylate cyclase [unclassified Meiothermus]